jgi:hypothetical protein
MTKRLHIGGPIRPPPLDLKTHVNTSGYTLRKTWERQVVVAALTMPSRPNTREDAALLTPEIRRLQGHFSLSLSSPSTTTTTSSHPSTCCAAAETGKLKDDAPSSGDKRSLVRNGGEVDSPGDASPARSIRHGNDGARGHRYGKSTFNLSAGIHTVKNRMASPSSPASGQPYYGSDAETKRCRSWTSPNFMSCGEHLLDLKCRSLSPSPFPPDQTK